MIRKVAKSTGILTRIAGNHAAGAGYSGDGGLATAAQFIPSGIALDVSGNIYISDAIHNVVRMISKSTGIISTMVGTGCSGISGDGGPATSAVLAGPLSVA